MLPHIHYHPDQVHCPTIEKSTERLLFSIAAAHGWACEHMNITNAYIHEPSKSPEPIFVRELPRWDGTYAHGRTTGRLVKNLWGGKAAGNIYIKPLLKLVIADGFTPTDSEPCIFAKTNSNGTIAVAINVDDFIVVATKPDLIDKFYKLLCSKYAVKRLGHPTSYLGWTVKRSLNGDITLSQPALALKTIQDSNLENSNGRRTPYLQLKELHPPIPNEDVMLPDTVDAYSNLVGDLRYLADCARTDFTYVVGKLGIALNIPTKRHWGALKAVVRYLRATVHTGILYRAGKKRRPSLRLLHAYTDSKFAGDLKDRKSTSGEVMTYNGTAISWSSRKKSLVALSTAEVEYVALASALNALVATKRLVVQSRLMPNNLISLKIDNTATRDMIANEQGTKRRKFIDVRHHYIQNCLNQNGLRVAHVSSRDQRADMFTKPLARWEFARRCAAIGITDNVPYGGVCM